MASLQHSSPMKFQARRASLMSCLSVENDALGQRQFAGIVDGIGLTTHVGLPGIGTGFTPAAGFLLTTKCSADLCTAGADVDVGNAAVTARRTLESLGFTKVGGEDAGRQALWHFVVETQCLLEFVVGQHIENRRKGFVTHDIALRRHLGNGRSHVVAIGVFVLQLALAAEDLATLIAGLAQRVLHGCKSLPVDQRADQVACPWVANPYLGVGRFHTRNHFVLDGAMYDQATQRSAALAGSAYRAEQDAAHGQIQVGARGQDHGVVAAQLQNAATETSRHTRTHFTPHAGTAGGAHQRHTRIIDQRLTGFTITDDQLRQTFRCIAEDFQGLIEQGLAGQSGQRGFLGRLPDHRVAAHQCQRGVPGPDRHREVEGTDNAHHAQRMPGFTHVVAWTFGGDGQAVKLTGKADSEVADIDHFLHFTQTFLSDLAGFDGHQFAQRRFVFAQHFTEDAHQLATAWSRNRAPFQKRAVGAVDAGHDLRLAFQADGGNLAAIDRGVDGVIPFCVSTFRYAQAF
ncbi:hypothetical protein ALQ47_05296 [Pseudomonas cichorii]|nr:hypothetical protein ALQ47_05296 [Pseudomonas cichorii]